MLLVILFFWIGLLFEVNFSYIRFKDKCLMLNICFSCEVEAKPRDFAVAAGQELGHAEWNEVFVNLDLNGFILTCAFDCEACFDVYVHA